MLWMKEVKIPIYLMDGWTQMARNTEAGECRSCNECGWMGLVVVISAVDERISKKTNLLDGWMDADGWYTQLLVNANGWGQW